MSNLMQRGATWLGSKLQFAAGRSVTLTQGATNLAITAWHSLEDYEIVETDGTATRVVSYDWSLPAADLAGLTLRAGARITDGDAVYELMALGKRPCVENADSSGILLLLHTKKVA